MLEETVFASRRQPQVNWSLVGQARLLLSPKAGAHSLSTPTLFLCLKISFYNLTGDNSETKREESEFKNGITIGPKGGI